MPIGSHEKQDKENKKRELYFFQKEKNRDFCLKAENTATWKVRGCRVLKKKSQVIRFDLIQRPN